MKHFRTLFTLCLLVLSFNNVIATCTCGLSSGTKQYPSSTLTPTTTLQTATAIWGGNYTLFNVVNGNTYEWSYCSADGGSASWDTRLNLYKENSAHDYIDCNSDYCGLQSKITWTADFTGVVRLITNKYINSSTPCGTNTTNATLAYKITGSSGQPDLTVSNQSLSSNTITAGSTVNAYARENNIGTSTAGTNVISIHLSANSILTPGLNGDTYLNEIAVSSSVSAGNNSGTLGPKSITIPSGTTPGSYYIFFSADGGQVVTESDEYNNFATVQITVQAPCTYTLSASSDNFPANGGVGSFMVNTQSTCSWTATTGDNWISTSSSNTGTGRVDYTVQTNSNTNSRTGTINAGGKTFTITQDGAQQQKPDLTLGNNINVTPNPVMQGSSITIKCDFKNLGLGNAQNVITTFWLSNNCTGSIGNDYLLGTSSSVSVSANTTNTQNVQLNIPIDVSWLGTKYIKCWIDYSDVVVETNENNNLLCTQVVIQTPTGQGFELNETSITDTSIISHLRWPFGRSSNWADRKGFNGGSEFNGVPSGHGEDGHDSGEFYADDWVNQISTVCGDSFFTPIGGKIIYLYQYCTSGCTALQNSCGNGFGNHIVIQSTVNPNFAFRVAHLKNISPEIIDKYNTGQTIQVMEYLGAIGATGKASGPHAHCVLYQNIYSSDDIAGATQQAYDRLTKGLSAGIGSNAPYTPTIFAANFKFDAQWGGVVAGGGPSNVNATNLSLYNVIIYPNPNSGAFTMHFETIGEVRQMTFNIYNMIGGLVYSESFQSVYGENTKSLQLNYLPAGVYIVFLSSENGTSKSRVVIKK